MKALIAVMKDNSRHLLMVVSSDFDSQAWANKRLAAFGMLEIVRIVEEVHLNDKS